MTTTATTANATAAKFYGATYSTDKADFGAITSIFEVDEDWDGFRYHGYCWATEEAIAEFLA